MTANNDIAGHVEAKQAFGQAICESIAKSIARLGFPESLGLKAPRFEDAVFSLVTDPYTQSQELNGFWYDANQQRLGQIKFNCENGFYAEYDILQPHPTKKQWFVEAINAWGKPDDIRTEAKLLDIPQ
jgi:hypothetical protein